MNDEAVEYTSIPAPMEYLVEGRKIMLEQKSARYTVEVTPATRAIIVHDGQYWQACGFGKAARDKAEFIAAALNTAAGVSELVEALRPFAALVRDFDGYPDGYEVLAFGGRVLTAGDCRRAAEVLEKWEDGK